MISIGQALLSPLKLRQKGLVPAAPARRACATSTPSSSARQTFPSGLWPAVKDCFGLHGYSAFGYVAKRQIGVGRKSVASDGHTTDLVHWLQAGKTVDILRCAAESTDLLPPSALPRSLRSLRLSPPCGGPTTDVSPLTRTCHRSGFRTPVGCADIPFRGNFRPHGRWRRSSCCRYGW